jgi:hypothetical protein
MSPLLLKLGPKRYESRRGVVVQLSRIDAMAPSWRAIKAGQISASRDELGQ